MLETLCINSSPIEGLEGKTNGLSLDLLPRLVMACPVLRRLGACFQLMSEPPNVEKMVAEVNASPLRRVSSLVLDLGASFFNEDKQDHKGDYEDDEDDAPVYMAERAVTPVASIAKGENIV